MKRKAVLSALLAVAMAAPAVIAPSVAPSLAPNVQAQAEYPDVPLDHWAYNAINKLSQAGIIEGYPNGTYSGGRAMTRYEFAVAIARILQNIQAVPGPKGDTGATGATGPAGAQGAKGEPGTLANLPADLVHRKDLQDAIAALTNEFKTELNALGVRVGDLENRVTALENRVVKPPRLTFSAGLLQRTGTANYINNDALGRLGTGVAYISNGPIGTLAPGFSNDGSLGSQKFSYTDFELRLTDRITDNLSLNAALRSLSGTQEDPWTGESGILGLEGGNSLYVREANVVANLGNRLGTKGLTAVLGRQRTKIAQGLLYDNDLAPTDQLHAMFNLGAFEVGAFIGSSNNNTVGGLGLLNPYVASGANAFIGSPDALYLPGGALNGSAVGFPGIFGIPRTDDNEAAVHAAVNLFRISGQPVRLGGTYLFDGIGDQEGYGADLSIPLFNRVVGVEYVKQRQYASGADSDGHAFNITVPVLRLKKVDLDLAYGKANDDFEYFLSSSANPFARTYGEAIFDRPLALGAPLINGAGPAGSPQFMAAKKVFDVNGTLRLIKSLPLQFRYYTAKGTDGIDLGNVWSVGTNYSLTQGLDLEVKYGQYNPKGDYDTIKYFRVGANVGF
jgi:hypothetical protein